MLQFQATRTIAQTGTLPMRRVRLLDNIHLSSDYMNSKQKRQLSVYEERSKRHKLDDDTFAASKMATDFARAGRSVIAARL